MEWDELSDQKRCDKPKDLCDVNFNSEQQDNNGLVTDSNSKFSPKVVNLEVSVVEQDFGSSKISSACKIEKELNSIFQPKKNSSNCLANRRDVVNKTILRCFKRYFVSVLNPKAHKISGSSIEFKNIERTAIITRARDFGILDLKSQNVRQAEFEELISWLGFAKLTKRVRSLFSEENFCINLIEDILTKYSHNKLNQILKNRQIKVLLQYFINNERENFLNNLKLSQDIDISLSTNQINHNCMYESYNEAFQHLMDQI